MKYSSLFMAWGILGSQMGQGAPRPGLWTGSEFFREVVSLEAAQLKLRNSVVKTPVNFTAWLNEAGIKEGVNPYTLRVEALDGPDQGKTLLHRYDRDTDPADMLGVVKGSVVFVVPDPGTKTAAICFGGTGPAPDKPPLVPLIGDGDSLRVAGDGLSVLPTSSLYPSILDFDGEGTIDLIVGSGEMYRNHAEAPAGKLEQK